MSDLSAAIAVKQEDRSELPATQSEPVQEWMDTKAVAGLADISDRAVRMAAVSCLSGSTWRGVRLEVRHEGRALLIHGPSLPPELRDIWHKRYQSTLPPNLPAPVTLAAPTQLHEEAADRFNLIRWKLSILTPALEFPKGSHGRGKALRDLAGKEYIRPDGKAIKPAYNTLAAWIEKYVTEGEAGLVRKPRAKGERRTIINRQWDTACPLPDEEKTRIGAELEAYIRSLWAAGTPGVNKIEGFATSKLMELCRAAGWMEASLKNCAVGRHPVELHREVALIALKERNAKEFFDNRLPRIKVNRKQLKPGDVVIGDVHRIDVAWKDTDRTVHARLIAWLDLATYDIFVSVVILPEGRDIRQEDVARSFVDMVQAWGLPKQLRLDNGKEYKWQEMMEGFDALAYMVRSFQAFAGAFSEDIDQAAFEPRNPISRARPYNAPAKQIEGVFGIVERFFFSMIPGWIGGDRMNKRPHKVGEAPRPHDGDEERFIKDISICLDIYRNTAQADGSSPNDKRRAAVAEGWQRVVAAPSVFLFAFSEVRKYTVHNQGINVDGQWGICDALIPYIGRKVDIRVAKWHRSHTFFLDPEGTLHAITMGGNTFDHDDPAGAKEQARMVKVQNAYIRELKAGTVPLNLMDEAARHLAAMPPAPQLPDGITITTAESDAITQALETAKAPPKLRLLPGQFQHPTTGAVIDMAPCKEEGSKATPIAFDPLNFTIPTTETQTSNQEEPDFDLVKALIANHEANNKEAP